MSRRIDFYDLYGVAINGIIFKVSMKKQENQTIGQFLMGALTESQAALLLTEILPYGDQLEKKLAVLEEQDADLANTVRKVLVAERTEKTGRPSGRVTSMKRALSRWDELWRRWNRVVAQVGGEEGKYAFQEHHWEPPSFDGYALSSDLESVAGEMAPLIETVFPSVNLPDLFADALDGIEDNIACYPEWMGVEYGEGCMLEARTTECVLQWLWLASRECQNPGRVFLERLVKRLEAFEKVELQTHAFVAFFSNLPDAACREIYDILGSDDSGIEIGDVHSGWYGIVHEYQGRFDPDRQLAACAAHLNENWRFGRPLVEDAFLREEYEEAESWLQRTFASFIGPRANQPWAPESGLLLETITPRIDKAAAEIGDLLKIWSETARKTGRDNRAAAAEFQRAVVMSPDDWDTVFSAYHQTAVGPARETIDRLLAGWKNDAAGKCIGTYFTGDETPETWIHWLVDAALDREDGPRYFAGRIERWLEALEADGNAAENQWLWLARFTADIDKDKTLNAAFPAFRETVLPREIGFTDDRTESRRTALKSMGTDRFLSAVMAVWQQQLHRVVPDPATVHKSNYNHHAAWAEALRELSPQQYQALVKRWRKKHNRRRNLWRDLKARGLPV